MSDAPLPEAEIGQLQSMNTPTIYNGWEQITRRNAGRECFNLEPVQDYMPQLGAMVGYAVTLVVQPGEESHAARGTAWSEYRKYIGSIAGPKILIIQDLDKPRIFGAVLGEVNATVHRGLGCVGAVVDGAVRDIEEMATVGFKTIARGACVGHAFGTPIRWGCPVEVFGCPIQPGQLIHADRHGFLAVPAGEERRLLEAARYMDDLERRTKIKAARDTADRATGDFLSSLDEAYGKFRRTARERYSRSGEA